MVKGICTKFTKEQIKELYINQKQSIRKCEEILKVGHRTICHWMGRWNISIRSKSETAELKHQDPIVKERYRKARALAAKKRDYTGANNGCWNPNREQVIAPYTEMFYNESYREMIIRQQDYICPLCNKDSDEIFDLHHIDFGKLNDDRYNLIFLHHSCHGKVKDIPEDIEKMQEINNKICMSILAA